MVKKYFIKQEVTKPIKCTICFNHDEDKITNIIKGEETNAWFCLKCGGLIKWIK